MDYCPFVGFKVRFFSVNASGRKSVSFSFQEICDIHKSVSKGLLDLVVLSGILWFLEKKIMSMTDSQPKT